MGRLEEDERDRLDDRFGDKDGRAQRVSDGETEKKVLKSYDVGLSERKDERSSPKLKLVSEFRCTHHSPPLSPPLLHTMDISSVRVRPVPVMAQAVMTSTHGHPRPNLPEMGKVNIGTKSLGFDVCREKKRERNGREREEFQREINVTSRRLYMDDLTNREIEVTIEEMEKEMSELKGKM